MNCSIKKEGLQYVIDVDGKTIYPSAYMTYCMEQENIDDAKKNGIKFFMFPAYAGDEGINMSSGLRPFCDNFFKGYGEYDFTVVDEMLSMIAPTGDEEVYIIPRVCVEPPKWWQQMHPQEVARDFRGEALRECFASQKWREDMTVALKALIDHVESSKWKNRVIGYHIAAGGTEEWAYQARYAVDQFYDYAQPNLRAYRSFLQEKYQTPDKLSAAWKQEITDWEDVIFPTPVERTYAVEGFLRKPETEQHVLDFFDFHNEIVAETIIYFCRQVKEYTQNTRLTGVFYGYVFGMPHSKKGLHAMGTLVRSPYVDFISTTNDGKEEGEAWSFLSAVQSALFNKKMWICEGDIRTCKTIGLQDKMPHAAPDNNYYGSAIWKGPATLELSCSVLTKALARALMTPCGIWWFDMFGGWFADPAMMNVIGRTEGLLRQQQRGWLNPEIAVFIDERGHKYSGINEYTMAAGMVELIRNLSHMGTTYHNYLLSDLTDPDFPVEDYKLFIFVAATNPSEKEAQAITEKLKRNGKTILWLHTSSFYNRNLSEFALTCPNDGVTEKGVFKGEQYPSCNLPILRFQENSGYVLSRLEETREPAVIWKKQKDYNVVYSLHLAPTPKLLRHIALLSGVHMYNLTGDCVYACGEYVAIHAIEAGYRRLALPERGFRARNAMTGAEVTVNDMFIDMKMDKHDTIILHLDR